MSKKILIIEDNTEMRENTAEILELANYTVLTAKNGKEGVELAEKEHPDLIICDIMMPVLDGFGVLHLLNKSETAKGIPFIFVTARSERSDFRKGMEMGADDYVTKPFDDIELLNAVESRLRKNEMLKRDFSHSIEGLNDFISTARGIEDLKKLSESREVRKYKKKENIYLEGNYPRGLYFVVDGLVKTYRRQEEGKELIVGLHKKGDFFGYLSLLEEEKYRDSAMAIEDTSVCHILKEDFYALIYTNVDVSRKFIKLLTANLKEREDQLVKIAYNSVRKRVAEALVTLNDRYKKNGDIAFSMNISREDLANLAGTATETTIRTLSDLKEEGLVEIKSGKITITNYEKLRTMRN